MLNNFDFKHPDYEAVYRERKERLKRLRADPAVLKGVLEHYKDNPVDFVNDWGMTFDPRNAEIGLPTAIPFILFPKQAEYLRWLRDRWLNREDGLAEKSRDMGVSWLCVAFGVWMWRFHGGTVVGFGSRKEEYVDKIGDPKTLFWKIREFIKWLPKELRPVGYNERVHAPYMRVLNPENGAAMIGEAGTNIGRGNRTSIYFKDESAFYERPEAIDAALSQTSNCKIDVSTPNGTGNPFHKKRHGKRIPVFTFHWRDDPRKDEAWYQRQVETLDPVIVAQEIDIDYNASVEDAWMDGQAIADAQALGPADVQAIGQWIIGVDAAHMGNDEHVIHKRKERLNLPQTVIKGAMDGPELAGRVTAECDILVEAGDKIHAIVIELDGPGVSCYDTLKSGKYAEKVRGVHTGARLNDGKNYNLRARMWREAKDYLKQPPVVMPRDAELKAQLGAMKYKYKDGLLLMQDKKEYKKLYHASPDRADAFVLTFVPTDKPIEHDPFSSAHNSGGWMSS
jgi:hypothetical protein